jgi:hypothetical protein
MEQELILQSIRKGSGKELVVLFIDYLERFVTNSHYANIAELLLSYGFSDKEVKEIEMVLYVHGKLEKSLEEKIKTTIKKY